MHDAYQESLPAITLDWTPGISMRRGLKLCVGQDKSFNRCTYTHGRRALPGERHDEFDATVGRYAQVGSTSHPIERVLE